MTTLSFQELTARLEQELFRLCTTPKDQFCNIAGCGNVSPPFWSTRVSITLLKKQGCVFWMNNSTFLRWRRPGS